MTASGTTIPGLRSFGAALSRAFLAITHRGLALLGLTLACAVLALVARPDLRQAGEESLVYWLQTRQTQLPDPSGPTAQTDASARTEAGARASAGKPQGQVKELPREQASVALWLSKRYRVAPGPLGLLVAEVYGMGAAAKIDPTLILAIMAIESGFNPFAESAMGAQGLMQVMTRMHGDKYQGLGGQWAAFDPVSNLRVGVRVLQECIARAGGSLEGGLRHYVGAANMPDDGGYAAKVMAEHLRLRQVASGQPPPIQPPAAGLSTQTPAQILPAAAPRSAPPAAADKLALLAGI